MTITQFKYFISIVNSGSFSQAAWENNITQSAISKQISSLEDEIGIKLFDRCKRYPVLTPVGEAFLSHAIEIVSECEQMLCNIQPFIEKQQHHINVSMLCLATHYEAWPPLVDFQAAYPDLEVNIRKLRVTDICATIDSDKCTFGILYDQGLESRRYITMPLASDRLALAVSKDHELAARETVSLSDLKNVPFVFTGEGTQMRQIGLAACKSAGFCPNIAHVSTYPEPVLSLVKIHNAGLLFLEKALRYYAMDRIKIIMLEEDFRHQLVLIRSPKHILTTAEKKFISYIKKHPYFQNK